MASPRGVVLFVVGLALAACARQTLHPTELRTASAVEPGPVDQADQASPKQLSAAPTGHAALSSWNDGPSKRAILDFVRRTTSPGPDFVPVEERVATFDNDGTLWSEQPFYFELAFTLDRVRELAPKHPEWRSKQPFKAVLEGDHEALRASGREGALALLMATHAGMTTDEFSRIVGGWLQRARHPRFNRPYTDLVYQPMLELLGYLRANDFKTFIVSGGGVEFMRAFAERVYGIPPEQVVGSAGALEYRVENGTPLLVHLPQVDFIDDAKGKPVGIQRFIGRRPLLAFGNSDGDFQMLEWTTAGDGPRFGGIVHHTDAVREWAYDRTSSIGRLDEALDAAPEKRWLVVDMKKDWKLVYPFEAERRTPDMNR